METHNIKAHAKEKHFKHYLFEFFMLFFAVALGFFVENMREKNTENQRGFAYLRSLFQDVNTDTAKLSMVILNFEEKIKGLDTLIRHFSDISSQKYPSTWMRNHGALSYYADFIYTDKTILQLKNSGGLRLINDPETADSIMNYDGSIKQLAIQETSVSSQENIVEKLDAEVIDHRKMNAISDSADLENVSDKTGWTLDNDKKLLGSFYNEIYFYKGICELYLRYLVNAKATAVRFINFLDNKYHFR